MKYKETPYILAIDVGTSALKAVLYTANGRILTTTTQRYDYQTPQPGWAEANPADWWTALTQALTNLRATGFDLSTVQVLGLTGQMHTAVLLDAEFWDTHSFANYWDEFKPVKVIYEPEPKKTMIHFEVGPKVKVKIERIARDNHISVSSLIRMWTVDKLKQASAG